MFVDASPHMPETQIFLFDLEDVAEMAGFIDHDQNIIKAMGGPLAEQDDLSNVHQVLDIACGPGSWVLDVAQRNPEIEVAGIDTSPTMIRYANARARSQGLYNASFEQMDILHPLDFSDNTFDLVNLSLATPFVPKTAWPQILQECLRITRPGGTFRTNVTDGPGHTNSAAYEKMTRLAAQAMHAAGFGFSPDGFSVGITPVITRLLKDAGYQNIQQKAHVVDFSTETTIHGSMYHNTAVICKVGQPFLVQMGMTTQEEVEQLYQQMLLDMLADDFCGIWFFLTAWGSKPL